MNTLPVMWPAIAILGFVTLQRLSELPIARANTAKLLAAGAHEVAPGHYPALVAMHAAWLVALWLQALGKPIHLPFLGLFILLQVLRIWTLRTLGNRWTTRIIVMPGETLVARGPYKYMRHPNYLVVIGEIAVLPLVFGLWQTTLVFSALNAIILWVRIRAEDAALRGIAEPALTLLAPALAWAYIASTPRHHRMLRPGPGGSGAELL